MIANLFPIMEVFAEIEDDACGAELELDGGKARGETGSCKRASSVNYTNSL